MMWESDLELDKYVVTHSGYFRLATTVALGMGITDGKLLDIVQASLREKSSE